MFNISKIQKETINNKKINGSEQQENKNAGDIVLKKDRLQNLILTQSLIVKL